MTAREKETNPGSAFINLYRTADSWLKAATEKKNKMVLRSFCLLNLY